MVRDCAVDSWRIAFDFGWKGARSRIWYIQDSGRANRNAEKCRNTATVSVMLTGTLAACDLIACLPMNQLVFLHSTSLQLRFSRLQLHNPRLLDFLARLPKIPLACKAPVQVSNHPHLYRIYILAHCMIDLLSKAGEVLSGLEKALDEVSDCLSGVVDSLLEGIPFVLHQDGDYIDAVDSSGSLHVEAVQVLGE